MNLWKNQKGFSLGGLIVMFIVGAFVLIYGSQIGIAYINKNTVKSAVESVLMDTKSNDNATPASIKSAIIKKVSLGDTGLTADGLNVFTKSGAFVVEVKMEKEIELTSEISILVNFEFTEESQ